MQTRIKTAVVALGGVVVFVSSTALAAPAADGMFFIHGTGNQATPSKQVNPTDGAVTGYWTQAAINAMIADPAGGNWTYGAAGYQGSTNNAQTSAYYVASQLHDFVGPGIITNVVLITHSNGSNPVRYMTAHPTATDEYGTAFSYGLNKVRRVIFIAGDNMGTPLADKVTSSGSFASISNNVVKDFGFGNYNSAAVLQQVQATMATYNGNGTFSVGTAPGGLSTEYVYGSGVYAMITSSDAWCGGYTDTTGLKAAQVYGWGSSSAATDGFIGVNSSTYVGTAGMSGDARLNHNQSRRACHGVGATIETIAHGAMSGAFAAIPPDYTISPAAQACNATTQGWSGNYYWLGCTSAMKTDTKTDIDCYVSYGGDNGYVDQWTGVNPQNGVGLALSDGWNYTGYSAASNYANGGVGCSDTWLGDGQCDLCLLAKYGFDSASGTTQGDDCVNAGAGTNNTCADIAWYSATKSLTSGSYAYFTYTATH